VALRQTLASDDDEASREPFGMLSLRWAEAGALPVLDHALGARPNARAPGRWFDWRRLLLTRAGYLLRTSHTISVMSA